MNSRFYLTHLYPKNMSIYGDMGNILALKYRLEKLGIDVIYQTVEIDEPLPANSDLYFIGGGQDKEQYQIYQDLLKKSRKLIDDVEKDTPILAICGGYQLLGDKFTTGDGLEIKGIGVFPVTTKAQDTSVKSRCVGNVIIKSDIPEIDALLVGFENHSGQTYFNNSADNRAFPLGKVLIGFGNNSVEKIEGCVYKSAIGTYLHGSCLPKNPELANFLLYKALEKKIQKAELPASFDFINFKNQIDDTISLNAKRAFVYKFAPEIATQYFT